MTDEELLALVKDKLEYDPASGSLTRKHGYRNTWAGREAARQKKDGYLSVQFNIGKVNGKTKIKNLLAHRVAWALYYGEWPTRELHHIDGDKANNRIANLMLSDRSHNVAMTPIKERDLPRGVHLMRGTHSPRTGRAYSRPYSAILGKEFLGFYANPEEAHAVYKAAFERKYGEQAPEGKP